eukprot:Phypoly_transcript_06600.p1 GENE.Phypoly_transcript_06600~~Phypoly_transcript_06600.p1  ORF type:complete len:566 (+),score=113.46 Phypoly_transcript_06600:34-1698(+)
MDAQLKKEVAGTITKTLAIFTAQYNKAYLLQLVQWIKLEKEAEGKAIAWHLESRPNDKKENLKQGYITKESVHLKNWNKRYFVFKPDYNIDYYDSEELATQLERTGKEGKKRGTINLSGYYVIEDPNQGALVRLKRLAEKMNMDLSSLPKPKEYPPLTFEVHHPRRTCYFLKCDNKEEFDQWVAQFKAACWNARAFTWDDWCHQRAFPVALRKTRWEMGRWGYWGGQGTEEQLLAELIADELEYEIMGRIYGNLPGPWIIRNKFRNMALSTIDGMVLAAVKPAWAGMRKSVETARPVMEPKIREQSEQLFKAEDEINGKMKESVMGVLEPLVKEHVVPHLAKILSIIKLPVRDAFADAANLFDDKITNWKPNGEDLSKSFRDLDYFARSYWELRNALNRTDEMYEPLWALRETFPDIYPWGLIWKSHNYIYRHTDNAVYTWEQSMLKENNTELAEPLKRDVIIKYRHDTDIAANRYYAKTMKKIVMPPFEAAVQPAAKHIIEPMADSIPSSLKDFIDIKQNFEDFYTGVVMDKIHAQLNADGPDDAFRSVSISN